MEPAKVIYKLSVRSRLFLNLFPVGRNTSATSTIVVDDLTIFQADGSTILDGAKLNLQRGRVYALFGNNGVGKTTLVRCLAEGLLGLPEDVGVHVMEQLIDPNSFVLYTSCLEYVMQKDTRLVNLRSKV